MPSTVCMPGKFADLCDDLNEDQIKLVHEMGLGPLLNVRSMSIRRILLESLADGYSETDRSFTVGEHVVPICIWDVECILGLPNQGEKITISKNRADPKLFALYKGDKAITFTHLEKRIRSGVADEHFIRMFVLYAIGTVLAPCSKEYVSSHYLEVVADISKIKKYNWAEFTLEYLLTNLAEFKKNKRSGLVGNLALLQVWYFEHFQAHGDDFAYDHHEHPLIKNWDQQQCDKRMVFDAKNKMGAAKVVMCLRVNYSDTRFTCDPIVDGIIDESPKETNNGCFEDEKKHRDLDGLDYDAKCDTGHQTDNLEGGEPNFEARLRVVEERTRLVPKLYSKMQAIERMLGYNHGLSLDYDMDMRSGNPSLQDQLSLIPSIAHKLDNVMAQLIGKRGPMVSEVLPCNSQETKKLRMHCKEEMSNIVSPLKKKADPHASTVVGMVKTRVNRMASNIGKPNTFQCTDARKAHGTSIEEVKSVDLFSGETSPKNAKMSSPTPLEKVESIANLEVSSPTFLEGVKSIEMFSSETPLKNKVKSSEENEVSSPTLVDKIKSRTHRKRSKICSSPYVSVKSRAKFVPDNIHIDDITRGLDLSDLEVAAIKFVQKQLVLDAERVVVCIGQIELICSKMASLIRPVNENGVNKWLYDDIINLYATMFNSLWAEESVKYALSTFDSKFLIAVGKEWLTHGKFIRKQKKRANELCRSLIRHDMVPVPMNIDEDHWWLVVINLAKQEWQILDSYDRTLEYYIEVTRPFRNGVHSILQSFSSSMESRWSNLDVLSWRIVVVKEIPRQYDICSCGIFSIKFMKNWNGSELTSYFSQEHMETFRKKMPSEILLSSSNKISVVGKEVRDMLDV